MTGPKPFFNCSVCVQYCLNSELHITEAKCSCCFVSFVYLGISVFGKGHCGLCGNITSTLTFHMIRSHCHGLPIHPVP